MKKWIALFLAAMMSAAVAAPSMAADTEEPVSLIKEITCADYESEDYAPAFGFDGDMNTRMSITIDDDKGETLIAELTEPTAVAGLNISWNNGHTRYYVVEVSTSLDGAKWTVVHKRGNTAVATEAKGFAYLPFSTPQEAKYIKIQCWGKAEVADDVFDGPNKSWLTFWEMDVIPATYANADIVSVTSSAYQAGYPMVFGFDGNINTRLSMDITSEAGEELVIELARKMFVSGLNISWNNGHTRFYDVEVSVSANGKDWTVATPRTGTAVAKAAKGFSEILFAETYEAKYVKIHCWGKTDLADGIFDGAPNAKGNVQSWLTFWECDVYASDTIAIPGTAEIVDMTCVDFQEGYPAELGFDGDLETRMSITIDDDKGEYIIAELDKVHTVAGLDISWNNGHNRYYVIEVSTSVDGENWTVAAKRGNTAVAKETKGFSNLTFETPVDAKYVKIHCWGKAEVADDVFDGANKSWLTFWEMNVNTVTYQYVTADEEVVAHVCETEWAPVTKWVDDEAWVSTEAWTATEEWVETECWTEDDTWF